MGRTLGVQRVTGNPRGPVDELPAVGIATDFDRVARGAHARFPREGRVRVVKRLTFVGRAGFGSLHELFGTVRPTFGRHGNPHPRRHRNRLAQGGNLALAVIDHDAASAIRRSSSPGGGFAAGSRFRRAPGVADVELDVVLQSGGPVFRSRSACPARISMDFRLTFSGAGGDSRRKTTDSSDTIILESLSNFSSDEDFSKVRTPSRSWRTPPTEAGAQGRGNGICSTCRKTCWMVARLATTVWPGTILILKPGVMK